MSVATQAPFPVPRGLAIALAALGPVAVGGILAARAHDASPMLAAPAIVFGVVAATGPALYIATRRRRQRAAARGRDPRVRHRARCVRHRARRADPAGGVRRGVVDLGGDDDRGGDVRDRGRGVPRAAPARRRAQGGRHQRGAARASLVGGIVFLTWAVATAAIAGRLWWDLAVEVVS